MQQTCAPLIVYLSRRKRYHDALLRRQKRSLLIHLLALMTLLLAACLIPGCSAPPPVTPVAVQFCPQIPTLPAALQHPRKADHLQQAQAFVQTL